jgi:hypothetical protein
MSHNNRRVYGTCVAVACALLSVYLSAESTEYCFVSGQQSTCLCANPAPGPRPYDWISGVQFNFGVGGCDCPGTEGAKTLTGWQGTTVPTCCQGVYESLHAVVRVAHALAVPDGMLVGQIDLPPVLGPLLELV